MPDTTTQTEILPAQGGSYIRHPDGTLTRVDEVQPTQPQPDTPTDHNNPTADAATGQE